MPSDGDGQDRPLRTRLFGQSVAAPKTSEKALLVSIADSLARAIEWAIVSKPHAQAKTSASGPAASQSALESAAALLRGQASHTVASPFQQEATATHVDHEQSELLLVVGGSALALDEAEER